ncbi:sulfotransferase family protein [Francisellaceae bacterium]|nr:sulfotransferase family protein [Francisellaceae bacterium]
MIDIKNLCYKFYVRIFPRKYIEYINLRRRRNIYTQAKIIFIHVPKAAGTSVCHSLYGKTLGHFKAKNIQKALPNEFREFFTFSLVRHPYDRVLSAYQFAKQGKTDVMGISNPKKYQINDFISFETFVTQWLVEVDLTEADYVFQPQYLFTHGDNDQLLVNKIWKVEQMDRFYEEFEKYAHKKIEKKHINQSKSNASEKNQLSTELKKIIYQCYQKDFELFNYQK